MPGGASESSTIDGISISTIGSRDQPRDLRVEIRALHVRERRRHDDAAAVMRLRRATRAAHVKSGNSDSATFIRNVPEPQR